MKEYYQINLVIEHKVVLCDKKKLFETILIYENKNKN